MDLQAEFISLRRTSSDFEFAAIPLSSSRRDFLAKTKDGSPIFLLHDGSPANFSPGLKLRNLSVEYQVTCRVNIDAGPIVDQFALISCDDSMPDLFELFIRCFAASAARLPAIAGTPEISANLHGLLELFRTMSQPSGRMVSGLWAELFIIAKSKDIEAALSAWRNGPFERFDFSLANQLLEIKATTKEARIHEFSMEQLQVPLDGCGHIASLLLQPINGGVGIMDLAMAIENNLSGGSSLRQKLWANIASALGSDFSSKLDTRFDTSYAERNFILFAMDDIPRPPAFTDERISNVRFHSDLTAVKSSLPSGSMSCLGTIF